MKKVFYVMLALLLASTVSMNAQVRIGNTTDPHAGAVLDLKSTETTGKGVLFPSVNLLDVDVFQLSGDAAKGEGMIIYNTNEVIGKGLYLWDGEKWNKVNGMGEDPTSLILTGTPADWVSVDPSPNAGDGTQSNPYLNPCPGTTVVLAPQSDYAFGSVIPADAASLIDGALTFTASGSVVVNKGTRSGTVYVEIQTCVVVPVTGVTINPATVNLTATGATQALTATVAPDNATNKAVTWSSSNTTVATVDANGLVTAKATGTAVITATTDDGGKTATSTIMVTIPNTEGSVTGSRGIYKTYTYQYSDGSTATWMVTNSREGTYSATCYDNNPNKSNGFYYTHEQASSACPSGWHLPTRAEWEALREWVNPRMPYGVGARDWYHLYEGVATGKVHGGSWCGWDQYGIIAYWWGADRLACGYSYLGPGVFIESDDRNSEAFTRAVRCVMD